MTPDEQVKEIIRLLSPDDQNQTDAVFLVRRYMEKATAAIKKRDTQIQMVGAELEESRLNLHNVVNRMLDKEGKHREEVAKHVKAMKELKAEHGIADEPAEPEKEPNPNKPVKDKP